MMEQLISQMDMMNVQMLVLAFGEILLGICIIMLERKKQNKNK